MRIFVVLLISMSLATANPLVVLSGNPPAAAAAAYEGFETTTSGTPPTNWLDLDSGTGATDWHYTTSPIVGTASLFLPDSSSGASEVAYDFPEDTDADVYAAFKVKMSADPAVLKDWMWFTSSVPADLARLRQSTNGNLLLLVDASTSSNLLDMTPGTVYRIKVRYNNGTGSNETFEVWANAESDGAWGASLVTQSNGTSTARAGRLKFTTAASSNTDMTLDNVKVSTSDIAWSDID